MCSTSPPRMLKVQASACGSERTSASTLSLPSASWMRASLLAALSPGILVVASDEARVAAVLHIVQSALDEGRAFVLGDRALLDIFLKRLQDLPREVFLRSLCASINADSEVRAADRPIRAFARAGRV